MPIEIRELHIKVTVSEEDLSSRNKIGSTGQNGLAQTDAEIEKEQIVAECVEKVLEIMRNKSER